MGSLMDPPGSRLTLKKALMAGRCPAHAWRWDSGTSSPTWHRRGAQRCRLSAPHPIPAPPSAPSRSPPTPAVGRHSADPRRPPPGSPS